MLAWIERENHQFEVSARASMRRCKTTLVASKVASNDAHLSVLLYEIILNKIPLDTASIWYLLFDK